MEEKYSINLDAEAQELFEQFAGLESWKGKARSGKDLADSLLAEQRRHDQIRIRLVHVLSLIRYYLVNDAFCGDDANETKVFKELSAALTLLSQRAVHLGFILIRFQGASEDPHFPAKYDFEIAIGNTVMNRQLAPRVAKRGGEKLADLPDRFLKACMVLADYGVNNLCIDLPNQTSPDFTVARTCLKMLSGFRTARETGTPFKIWSNGLQQNVSVINDENMFPDPNLTMLAGINRISVPAMETLVNKVDTWLRKQTHASKEKKYAGVYNAALNLPRLSARLKKPAVELNNVKWMLVESDEEDITLEMAHVAKLVMELSGASPQKAAKILRSVYGKDYAKVNTPVLGERLNLSSDLLNNLENRPKESHLTKEVLTNLQARLDQVRDQVIDEIMVREAKGKEQGQGPEGAGHAVHSQIYKMVNFFKGRSTTRKKMTGMVHRTIEFTKKDYEVLAQDFRITEEQAQTLVEKLKACFDAEGRFVKSAFIGASALFRKYEQKIFHFLWHHMKDVILPEDRVAFLNALQSLTSQMDQPKRAFKILIEDICSEPETIKFSDDKAVMLANLIIQRDKSLTNYDITPEDVVLNRHAIDTVVAEYAAWRLEKDHEEFLTKFQTIHKKLAEGLTLEKAAPNRLPVPTILNIERELYIFLSLVECEVGKIVLRSAVGEYGSPEAAIFHQKKSEDFLGGLLQNLRVSLRGLGSVGVSDDLSMLEKVRTQEETFLRLKNDQQYRSQARLITEWVDEAVKFIKFRG